MLELMDKGKAQNKSPMIENRLEEESQGLIKTQQMPKVNPKKIKGDVFWCVYDKAFTIFKSLDWLFIKEKLDLRYDLC